MPFKFVQVSIGVLLGILVIGCGSIKTVKLAGVSGDRLDNIDDLEILKRGEKIRRPYQVLGHVYVTSGYIAIPDYDGIMNRLIKPAYNLGADAIIDAHAGTSSVGGPSEKSTPRQNKMMWSSGLAVKFIKEGTPTTKPDFIVAVAPVIDLSTQDKTIRLVDNRILLDGIEPKLLEHGYYGVPIDEFNDLASLVAVLTLGAELDSDRSVGQLFGESLGETLASTWRSKAYTDFKNAIAQLVSDQETDMTIKWKIAASRPFVSMENVKEVASLRFELVDVFDGSVVWSKLVRGIILGPAYRKGRYDRNDAIILALEGMFTLFPENVNYRL